MLICGSGIGISIAANRHPEVRAALVHDVRGARLARQHNDANVICFGGRTIDSEVARDCLRVFLSTEFEGVAITVLAWKSCRSRSEIGPELRKSDALPVLRS